MALGLHSALHGAEVCDERRDACEGPMAPVAVPAVLFAFHGLCVCSPAALRQNVIGIEIDRRYVKEIVGKVPVAQEELASGYLPMLSHPAVIYCCWRVAQACQAQQHRPVVQEFV